MPYRLCVSSTIPPPRNCSSTAVSRAKGFLCQLYALPWRQAGGNDEAVQPSVDAYNRYILDKLGITRDELLNNFILPNTGMRISLVIGQGEERVINRFSNGILVDEAIAKVEEDIVPLSEKNGRWNWNWPGWTGVSGCYRSRYAGGEKPEPSGAYPCGTYHGTGNSHSSQEEQIRTGHENVDRLEEQLCRSAAGGRGFAGTGSRRYRMEACLEKIAEMMSLFPDARQTDWDKVIAEKKDGYRPPQSG